MPHNGEIYLGPPLALHFFLLWYELFRLVWLPYELCVKYFCVFLFLLFLNFSSFSAACKEAASRYKQRWSRGWKEVSRGFNSIWGILLLLLLLIVITQRSTFLFYYIVRKIIWLPFLSFFGQFLCRFWKMRKSVNSMIRSHTSPDLSCILLLLLFCQYTEMDCKIVHEKSSNRKMIMNYKLLKSK